MINGLTTWGRGLPVSLRKNAFSIGMIAVTCIWIVMIIFHFNKDKDIPVIEQGMLDLSGWDEREHDIFSLDGEWAFYPDQLLAPGDLAEQAENPLYVHVPGNWDGLKKKDGSTMQGKGYGTYRLVIRNAPTDVTLAIAKQYVRFSDRLYINGDLYGESGKPGETRESYEPRNSPYTSYFRTSSGDIDIVLQAANFDYGHGGVFNSIDLGLGSEVSQRNNIRSGLELMSFGLLLLFSLLFLSLYIWYRGDMLLLVFAAFSICFAINVITNGERLFLQLMPDTPFEIAFKIKYLSVYLMPTLLFFIAWKLMDRSRIHRALQICIVILAGYNAVILLFPFRIYSMFQGSFYMMIFVMNAVMVAVLFRHYKQRRFSQLDERQFQLLLAGYWLYLLCVIVVLLNSAGLVPLVLTNVTGLLLILSIGILLIYHYLNAYESMRRLTNQLQMADQMKDDFLLITSHELNTPLHGVISMSQSLLSTPLNRVNEREVREKLQLIRNTAYRMSNLVKDIIDSSRIKDGRLEVRMGEVDLIPCVQVVMEVFDFLAKGRNVQLYHRIAPDARMIVADEDRLLQMFYSVIQHLLRQKSDTIAAIESDREKGRIRISIRLGGLGEASRESDSDGIEPIPGRASLPVGLSIARELAELMGGEFECSEDGYIVTFWLNASKRQYPTWGDELAETAASREAPLGEGRIAPERRLGHVLVASADAVNVEHLYGMLSLEGYTVNCVGSDAEAAPLLSGARRPDLAIIDVLLPDSGGYELCRTIRKVYNQAELPVLFIVARSTPADIEAGIAAGGSDFISRPLDAGEVRVRVHTLLSMNRLVKEAATNEMAFLRSQIKPHFLYNALGTIMSLCYTDGARAGELLSSLSRYLRIIFHLDNTEETVTLGKEMELIGAYVDIEKERFGSRVQVEFDVDESLYSTKVMPLTIEPLVENAIRHGVSKQVEGGRVKLSIQREGELMRVTVEDDGVGMTALQVQEVLGFAAANQGVGFRNITRRLMHQTGKQPLVESSLAHGTKVTIWMPLE
ncbi:histidine kinase [Paenibacillus sp. GCM10027627]